ncbi:hypothetical protein PYCCODRAFT_21820 [Trametes coccinea BRFM310]|uniref:Uncharacterized protein n=1 Tax=Trametes coccinea (strain BRFM310) TaxID=1353009 RepID=A0A1Y2J7J6_TRAC3|nr:hypothetical protein PYCCODRAFT_21820 [Trametes coccinea BRFM310]
MTSTRAPVPPVDLKARIAAFQESQKAANASSKSTPSASATLPKPSTSSGNTNLRDRIASFEKQGAVPLPKSRFGFAPDKQNDEPAPLKRRGELYGNRIPGLSRPHLPVPEPRKGDKRSSSKPRDSTRLELDRYVTSPSPPGSPFLASDTGDSIGDVLSDGDPTSASDPSGAGQELGLSALVSPPLSESHEGEEEEPVVSPPADEQGVGDTVEHSGEASASIAAEQTDASAVAPGDDQEHSPSVVPPPAETQESASSTLNDVQLQAAPSQPERAPSPEPVTVVVDKPPTTATVEGFDPAVQAVIEQLDRAAQAGDGGAVQIPVETLETLATLGKEQQKSVQDMLDQLLLQQDAIDIATPVKQRFSLNGQLSSQAVLDFFSQQSSLSKDATNPTTPPRKTGNSETDGAQAQPNHFLSPTASSTYSVESPVGEEPLSPASDIYSSYYAATPAVSEKYSRALPAIPEAPDSPAAFKTIRRGTFGAEGDALSAGSSAPTSAPLETPSDDGLFSEQQKAGVQQDTQGSVAPSEGMVKLAGTPPRVTSPPLSVVIPQTVVAKPAQRTRKDTEEHPAPDASEAVIVKEPRVVVSPKVARGSLVAAPQSSGGSSSSSPASTYSPNSTYSGDGTSPSSSGPVSRKASTSSRGRRSHTVSPLPPSAPFEEPELTPIEGPKGFRAVVHGKVIEGKSRPVSMSPQYPDLPSPSPLNASGMSDLAALLADAVVFEKQLADVRTPSKKPRAAAQPPPSTSPPPPPASGRASSERPRPTQELPESPDDQDQFNRLSRAQSQSQSRSLPQPQALSQRQSQERANPRSSHVSGRPLPEHPRQSRPSTERSIERKASRPSLDRKPSRPSLDQSSQPFPTTEPLPPRPSTDSTSSRPHLQPMFLTADPNAVRIPLPARPKSAMAHTSSRSQMSTPPPPPPKSPPRTGYLTNLLSRAKSTNSLRPPTDPRDSLGSSSEDSATLATPPTPPYDAASVSTSTSETGSVRSSRIFKTSFSRASNFADRLLHRKDGSNQNPEVAIASGDDDDGQQGSQRALPRPPRPLPLPPQPQPPRGLPPPVPGVSAPNPNNLAPIPPSGQPQLNRRASWKSIASVSTTGISEALDTAGLYDSFPAVPDNPPRPSHPPGLPAGPAAYTAPRPAPHPPLPPPNQPLPPPPSQPLPAPPRGASHGAVHVIPPGVRPGLPANPASRPKTLPSRPKVPPQQLRSGMI